MNGYAHHLKTWRHELTHASRAYWLVQIAIAVLSLSFYVTVMGLVSDADGQLPDPFAMTVLRGSVESLQFLLFTHVLLRTVLRQGFVYRQPRARDWLLLALWMSVISLLMLLTTYAVEHLGLTSASNIQGVRYQVAEGELELDFELTGWRFYTVAWVNYLSIFLIWGVAYLAWKNLEQRRALQAEMRTARMQQLTHQLSPHFLFNAFNTIRGMIFEDQHRAADLVTRLSDLFRYHLQHDARTDQSLAEDWALAQHYLALESVRLESRLVLDVHLSPACLKRRVPSLTLLTLVENAIKHGIAPRPEGGKLSIVAQPQLPSGWQLVVSNPLPITAIPPGTRTGLANLRERLSLTFGERAVLSSSTQDERFVVKLELPE